MTRPPVLRPLAVELAGMRSLVEVIMSEREALWGVLGMRIQAAGL